ncbi:hypothetical protein BS17DRAFT_765085 [Gyrodon lividus]|nr:hypothetical protein BS17DRAFT_765085 [Gyrodon lividus]
MTNWRSLPLLSPLCLLGLIGPAVSLQAPYAISNFASSAHHEWPSPAQWQALNGSFGGRLEALKPWAAVCYSSDPLFDRGKCEGVLSDYRSDTARVQVPSALLWSNWEACGYGNGCALHYLDPQVVNDSVCHQSTIPPYSVSIMSAQDASAVVKWAVANNVKLTVKNTVISRTRLLVALCRPKDIASQHAWDATYRILPNLFQKALRHLQCARLPWAVVLSCQKLYMNSVYTLAGDNNVSVVLGTCPTVGAGTAGFLQGGGHGPRITFLEYELVTADGQIRKLNTVQNSDLFWAVCGGGPGSWGILTSITIQAFPAMEVSVSKLVIKLNAAKNTTQLATAFIALVGRHQNELVNNGVASSFIPGEKDYILNFYWPSPAAPLSILFPFFQELLSLSEDYTISFNETAASKYASVLEAETEFLGPFADNISSYGASIQMSSRLIPQSSLSSSESAVQVAEAISAGVQRINAVLGIGGASPLIFGSMPAGSRSKVDETGANPALYEAAWHVMFGVTWKAEISREMNDDFITAIRDAIDPLTAMGITGSYQAEGGAYEQNWQQAFFGFKYFDLLAIKRKYDPKNFFNSYKGIDWVKDLPAYQCYAKDSS